MLNNRYNLSHAITALCALIRRFVTYSQLSVATPFVSTVAMALSSFVSLCADLSTVSKQFTATLF